MLTAVVQAMLVPRWYSLLIDGRPSYTGGGSGMIYCGVGELFAAMRRVQRRGQVPGIRASS